MPTLYSRISFLATMCLATNVVVASPSYQAGEVIVSYEVNFKPTVFVDISTTSISLGTGVERLFLKDGVSVEMAVGYLTSIKGVKAQPNYIKRSMATANDPLFASQWALKNTGQAILSSGGGNIQGFVDADIDADSAWDITTGSPAVVVAVLDSGIDYTHPDIIDNLWQNAGEIPANGLDDDGNGFVDDVNGWDFVHSDNDPVDLNGHGTHVAGIIAARGNNASTVSGLSWNSKLMPLQVTDADGVITSADIAAAIYYAVDNGAKVINASYGETTSDAVEYDAISYANGMGVLLVAAACNDGRDNDATPCYPSSYDLPNIISVAASDQFDNRAVFSSWGATTVDLAAPGVSIVSTFPKFTSVWSTDFSIGQQGWTFGGTQNQWAVSGGTLQDSPAGSYLDNADTWARSPVIDLSGRSACRASIVMSAITFENTIDSLFVEGSTDGTNWVESGQVFSSGQLTGGKFFADVSAFNNEATFYLRLRLKSNGSNAYDGVTVTSTAIECYGTHDQNSYVYWDGTSVAAPFVSATAALLLAQTPNITLTDLRSRILDTVDTKASLTDFTVSGGRLNVANALAVAATNTPSGSGGGGGGSFLYGLVIAVMGFGLRSCRVGASSIHRKSGS